jgi:hypothetical protein
MVLFSQENLMMMMLECWNIEDLIWDRFVGYLSQINRGGLFACKR